MTHQEYVQNRRNEIVAVSHLLRENKIDFLIAIRRLACLKHEVSEDGFDEEFTIFVLMEDDTDHMPEEDLRNICSKDWLDRCDRELNEIKEYYSSEISEGCRKLIKRFAPT
ncbi:MAG TPA: DUF2489 domain-containing protein [Spirochaetes bacterium]|nr:DUF2489 domain-containing protein [Spirochaetota bacterium]